MSLFLILKAKEHPKFIKTLMNLDSSHKKKEPHNTNIAHENRTVSTVKSSS